MVSKIDVQLYWYRIKHILLSFFQLLVQLIYQIVILFLFVLVSILLLFIYRHSIAFKIMMDMDDYFLAFKKKKHESIKGEID